MSDLVRLSQIVGNLHWCYPRDDSVRWSPRAITTALTGLLQLLKNLTGEYDPYWELLCEVHMCAINREDPDWPSATDLWEKILATPAMQWCYSTSM